METTNDSTGGRPTGLRRVVEWTWNCRGSISAIVRSPRSALHCDTTRPDAAAWLIFRIAASDAGSSLENLVRPFEIPLFEAKVYEGDSWFADGRAIILDYSKSSFLVRPIRDEIRQVAEGLYLGQVFLGKKRVLLFMLEFPS